MRVPVLRARAVGWISDEPFPGIVQVEIVDADNRRWLFEDKTAVFEGPSGQVLVPSSSFRFQLVLAARSSAGRSIPKVARLC